MVDTQGDVCAVCLKPSCAYPARKDVAGGAVVSPMDVAVHAYQETVAANWSRYDAAAKLVLWTFAASAAAFLAGRLLSGCATLDAFATAHPDVVQKAETAVELAQCVDTAVVKYNRAEVASTAAAVTTIQPDAGTTP